MANAALKASVAALTAKLTAIEAENAQLTAEINRGIVAMDAAERDLTNTVGSINAGLATATSTLNDSHAKVIRAHEIQRDMDAIYGRMKRMELANKNIRECNNVKYYDFAVYRRVRKIVQGIMDNLDFSMASGEIVERSIAREQLQEPDYWLTALLTAIMAWMDDDRDRAEHSLERALSLDRRLSSSFMLVFNLRLHREPPAFRWFDVITDGPLMGSDRRLVLLFFSMLSDTVSDPITADARDRVAAYVRALVQRELEGDPERRRRAVDAIEGHFHSFARDVSFPYPKIAQHLDVAASLRRALVLARGTKDIIDHVHSILNVGERQRNEFLKSYVDEIVEEPCAPEREIYEKIRYNELIIKHTGDEDAARREFDEWKSVQETEFDILREMLRWLYNAEGQGEVNPQMRRNMLILTRDLHQEAGDDYIEGYRRLRTSKAIATVGEYSGPIDLGNPGASEPAVEAFYTARAAEEKAAIKDTSAYACFGVAAGIAVLSIASLLLPLLVLSAVAVAAGILTLRSNQSKRDRVDLRCEQAIRNVMDTFDAIGEEYGDYRRAYDTEDAYASDLTELLSSL